MKIKDYELVQDLALNDVLLIDGENGTKTITAQLLANALIQLLTGQEFTSGLKLKDLNEVTNIAGDGLFLTDVNGVNCSVSYDSMMNALFAKTETNSVGATNNFALKTAEGLKSITANDLIHSLLKLMTTDEFMAFADLTKLTATQSTALGNQMLVSTEDGNRSITVHEFFSAMFHLTKPDDVEWDVDATDMFLFQGSAGQKNMTASDLALSLYNLIDESDLRGAVDFSTMTEMTAFGDADKLLVGTNDGNQYVSANQMLYGLMDSFLSPEQRRVMFRGKNLGGVFTTEQKEAIQNGTFSGLFLGDYWDIGGSIWRIVDMNYWYNQYGIGAKHHVVIMPDKSLYTAKMNNSSTTVGGYYNSVMHQTNLENAKTLANSAFPDSIVSHKEYLCNAVTDGRPSGRSSYDVTLALPSEIMMYGHTQFSSAYNDGSSTGYTNQIIEYSKTQLALFQVCPKYSFDSSKSCWLRDVVSSTLFAFVAFNGYADYSSASYTNGVRPVFAVG
ncbi:MAG: hypothetical protein R3Y53_00825 [Bacillota bacterium]